VSLTTATAAWAAATAASAAAAVAAATAIACLLCSLSVSLYRDLNQAELSMPAGLVVDPTGADDVESESLVDLAKLHLFFSIA
jgi:hypothetical protein